MAIVKLFSGNREGYSTSWLVEKYGQRTGSVFEMVDSSTNSIRQICYGSGFEYSDFFYAGTIDKMQFFGPTGKLVSQYENINTSVETYNYYINYGKTSDYLYGYILRGNDRIFGSSEDDTLPGSGGSDVIDGGAGSDLLTFQGYDSSVQINLARGRAVTDSGTSVLKNIEDISGGNYGDVLIGNSQNNEIQGFGGNDAIDGGAGIDAVLYREADASVSVNLGRGIATGGSGTDTLRNIENVIGSRFDDTLVGSAGNNQFDGGLGNDRIDGLGGIDVVDYGIAPRAVAADLQAGRATSGFGTDRLISIEGVIGTAFNDKLLGNGVANILSGGAGNDVINGRLGKDTLSGGAGNDTFVFATKLSSGNIDRITDFNVRDDTIQVDDAIFTALDVGRLKAAQFHTGSGAHDRDDHIIYNAKTGALLYDADGSGGAAAQQFATLKAGLALTYADIVIV